MSIRLYVRSIHRLIVNQWLLFTNIRSFFQDLIRITGKKEKINERINLSRARLEKKREIINSGFSTPQNRTINFVR